jgi:hypothetical protein
MGFGLLRGGITALGLAFVALGCLDGAPRHNPLDPFSEEYEEVGVVEGRVTSYYAPFGGIDVASLGVVYTLLAGAGSGQYVAVRRTMQWVHAGS